MTYLMSDVLYLIHLMYFSLMPVRVMLTCDSFALYWLAGPPRLKADTRPKKNSFTQSGILLRTVSGYFYSDSGRCHSARRTSRIVYNAPARSKLWKFGSGQLVLGRPRTWGTSYTGANNRVNRGNKAKSEYLTHRNHTFRDLIRRDP